MSEQDQQDIENTEEVTETAEASVEAQAPALKEIFGFKKGMTAIYDEEGRRIPVTVLECKPWTVTAIKTPEKDGYEAVQIGYGSKKAKNTLKSEMGQSKKAKLDTGFMYKREVRGAVPENCDLGSKVSLANFEKGTKVQVTAKSKGRGFSGAMKRHGFGGGPASHGSGFHRRPGSIGMCTFPGRVMPGKKMPGQYGNKNITVSGLEVIAVNTDENVLMVKGAIPGSFNTMVKVAMKDTGK
jgi:large subunit ribosomal protein L3